MLRVITLNANGIRSAASKGLFDWLAGQEADVICLQETKAQEHQLSADAHMPNGYRCFFYDAQKKGYSGTALFARREPDTVTRGFGVAEFDDEGRYLEARFGKLSVISLYLPSGSSGPERQASKDRFLDAFLPRIARLRRSRREVLLCGDINIAHREMDLKNWRSNRKNSGFLPHERAWLDRMFAGGWVDVYRHLCPEATGEGYTWWSNRGQAWAKNVGWRIDYQIATPGLAQTARAASVYKAQRFSDHAPLIMDYDFAP
jgi:exodeoxyribonuclease-3